MLKSFQVIGRTVGVTLVDVDGLGVSAIEALTLVDSDGLCVSAIEAVTLIVGKTEKESDAIADREGDIVAAVGEATSDCDATFEG